MSFEMLKDGPKLAEQMSAMNPMMAQMQKMPGFAEMQRQQQAFMENMMAGWKNMPGMTGAETPEEGAASEGASDDEDLTAIRRQLAALEAKLSKMG
eukprot:m.8200 g.8200  ORF g.8200 m.8200 type:complete len:96 (+) comp5393_c0_seq1:1065-1352(+)